MFRRLALPPLTGCREFLVKCLSVRPQRKTLMFLENPSQQRLRPLAIAGIINRTGRVVHNVRVVRGHVPSLIQQFQTLFLALGVD